MKKTEARYAAMAWSATGYHVREEFRTFRELKDMGKWCREQLARGGRKVAAFSRERFTALGKYRATKVRRIGEFSKVEEVPGW